MPPDSNIPVSSAIEFTGISISINVKLIYTEICKEN